MNNRSSLVSLVLFIIMPFLAFIRVVFNYKLPETKNIIWLFIIFYGSTFIIIGNGKDADRYSREFVVMANDRNITFSEFTDYLYNENTRYVDVLQPMLSFILSRFTDSPKILFAVFALVFGYFYSRNIGFLLDKVRYKLRREAIPFLILFALTIAFWQINGFRFWAAAHIFIYGIFKIAEKRQLKGLLFAGLSIFMHFSFAMPVVILMVYLLLGNRLVFYFLFYFASFFITQVRPEVLVPYTTALPTVFEQRTESYLNEEYKETRETQQASANWYVHGRETFLRYMLTTLLLIVFIKYRSLITNNKPLLAILSFGLLLFSISMIFGSIPSMNRFLILSTMFIVAAMFIFVQQGTGKIFKWWVKLPFIASFLIFTIVEMRIGFDSIGVMTLIGNPVTTLFVEDNVSLINYIK
jgi:EpsG family